jgi:hypothetical protein
VGLRPRAFALASYSILSPIYIATKQTRSHFWGFWGLFLCFWGFSGIIYTLSLAFGRAFVGMRGRTLGNLCRNDRDFGISNVNCIMYNIENGMYKTAFAIILVRQFI